LAIGCVTWYGARSAVLVAHLDSSIKDRGQPEWMLCKFRVAIRIGSAEGRIGNKYWTELMGSSILEIFHASSASATALESLGAYMSEIDVSERKRPSRATAAPEEKLLVGRIEAAGMLSISCRASIIWLRTSNYSFAGLAHGFSSQYPSCEDSLAPTIQNVL
jgi:hypothetical protein